ncbi:hypothetical protein JXR93_07905 [bacterium]|nr:hypothetical protein [bacterium]
MIKSILLLFIAIFMFSCGSSQKVVSKNEKCKRDTQVVCSKGNAPVLEHLTDDEINANVNLFSKSFGGSYKGSELVKYQNTQFSEIDHCIATYQYYNCKAYCESSTISKEDKEKKDQEIIAQCSSIVTEGKKNSGKPDVTLGTKNRILIHFESSGMEINEDLQKVIYLAFEEKATESGNDFVIIDNKTKEEAAKTILAAHDYDQNDQRFLPELQKQLAANLMVEIKVTPLGSQYLLTNKFVLLETAVIVKTKNVKYNPENDPKKELIYDEIGKLAELFLNSVKK